MTLRRFEKMSNAVIYIVEAISLYEEEYCFTARLVISKQEY